MTEILKYSIKQHVRAKHIRIKVNGLGKVEVVAPPGVNSQDIAKFVQKNTAWIHKTLDKLKDARLNHLDLGFEPPKNIHLLSQSKHYTVSYYFDDKRPHVVENEFEILVYSHSKEMSIKMLRDWVQKKGRQVLVPWLLEVSQLHQINYNNVSIRGQKTRWGSCSSKKNINLNRNLLFLKPELINYLMVHELSHIIQPNHSKQFWLQVAKLEPDYKSLDHELSASHKMIPLWAYASDS